jgi:3-dehydroquinate dehydratase
MAKIVAPAGDERQALELLAAASEIRKRGLLPTTVVASGRCGRFTRLLAPHLGRSWALCQERVEEGGFAEQPLVAQARAALMILAALDTA